MQSIDAQYVLCAHQYKGTLNSARALLTWMISGEYRYPSDVLGEAHHIPFDLDMGSGCMLSLRQNDWLVKGIDGSFKPYTDREFSRTFVSTKDIETINTQADLLALTSNEPCSDIQTVTLAEVVTLIDTVQYHHFPDTTVIVCAIKLKHGFVVTGDASCLDPRAFCPIKGKQYAYDKAIEQIFPHVAYTKRLGKLI